jgi:hypothetical protein
LEDFQVNPIIRIATAFIPVISAVNMFGGIIAGIWLALQGDWWALGYGLVFLFVSHWLVSLLLIPFFLLSVPSMRLIAKGQLLLGRIVFALGSLYMQALMFLWCVFVTGFFLKHPRNVSLFPMMLWTYGVATGPWTFLAAKDQQGGGGNEFSMIATLFLQAGYLVGAVLYVFNPDIPEAFLIPLFSILVLHWIAQQILAREVFAMEAAGVR